jgi:hypothetical protein
MSLLHFVFHPLFCDVSLLFPLSRLLLDHQSHQLFIKKLFLLSKILVSLKQLPWAISFLHSLFLSHCHFHYGLVFQAVGWLGFFGFFSSLLLL